MHLKLGDKNDRIAPKVLNSANQRLPDREIVRWIFNMVPLLKHSRYYKAIFYSSQETVVYQHKVSLFLFPTSNASGAECAWISWVRMNPRWPPFQVTVTWYYFVSLGFLSWWSGREVLGQNWSMQNYQVVVLLEWKVLPWFPLWCSGPSSLFPWGSPLPCCTPPSSSVCVFTIDLFLVLPKKTKQTEVHEAILYSKKCEIWTLLRKYCIKKQVCKQISYVNITKIKTFICSTGSMMFRAINNLQ